MQTNLELYIQRATEFEAKADVLTSGSSLKEAYLRLARDYRRLAAHVERGRFGSRNQNHLKEDREPQDTPAL